MKKFLLPFFLSAGLLLLGCAREEIPHVDTTDDSSSGSQTETSLTDPELAWSASSLVAYLGGSNTFPTLSNPNGVTVSYASSDANVATIDNSSGAVTLVAEGTTVITASSEQTSVYEEDSAYYTLKVVKSDSGLAWSAESASVVIGEDYTLPSLINGNNLPVTYSSSEESIATIDGSTGAVSLIADGTTIITATFAGNDSFEAASASYTLTVTKNTDGISWSAGNCTVTLGASDNSFPSLNNPGEQTVAYASSNTDVATIATDGTVTLKAAGTTTITATSEAKSTDTVEYEAASVSYTLTVQEEGSNLVSADLAWPATSYSASMGSAFTSPTLTNPHGLGITYSSSNTDVATVDAQGTVTLVSAGTTTITATSAATDTYLAGSAYYTLTVSLAEAGLSWSAGTCEVTFGTSYSLPVLTNTNGLSVSYTSSNTDVATIDGSGTVTIVAAGTSYIKAYFAGDNTYAEATATYTLKVNKGTPTLSWSASAFTANLEDGSWDFPTLTTDPSGLSVTYSSSKTNVASVDASTGVPTPLATGSTTITATSASTDQYKSASATYTLSVKSSADDGVFTGSFSSAGDSSSDDDISNTSFTRLVTVTYSSAGASVSGYSAVADVMDVAVSGNQVTVNYSGSENVVYKLTGTASDGFFKLYSSKKQAIWLSGLSLTSTSGAAINNQSGKRTFVYVEGSNYLYDSSSAAYSTSNEDMKAVFFSEGQLVFSGSGSLTVEAKNAQEKSAIASDDYVRIMDSPTLTLTAGSSAGHGIRGKEYVQLSSGTLNITTSAAMKKGITSEDYVLVEGGSHTITVKGGVAYDSEDAEYKGSAGIKADNYFGMTGGNVTITNTGTGGKGVRAGSYDYYSSNGSLTDSYVTGGTLKITTSGSESNDVSSKAIKIGYKEKSGSSYVYGGNFKVSGGAIVASASKSETIETKGTLTVTGGEIYSTSSADDAINSYGNMTISGGYVYAYTTKGDAMDANGNLTLSGGYVFAVTTAGSPEVAIDANTEGGYKLYINSGATVVAYGGLESGYSASQTVYSMSGTAGSWNALYNGSSFIAAFKAPSGISSFTVSAPSLSSGYKGVSVGSTTYCNGVWATSGISGGTSVSLSSYSGGNQGGSPGGGGNQGGGPGGRGR